MFTYFICFTIVLFPDSPAPGKNDKQMLRFCVKKLYCYNI